MFRLLSIGVITQTSKQDHLEILWEALVRQTCIGPFEIILFSEEGATWPRTLENRYILRPFTYKKPFRIGSVRNGILEISKSKYLLFVDGDIAISPYYLEMLVTAIQSQHPTVLAGLTYHAFKRPKEFLQLYIRTPWEKLVRTVGKRDNYSRRIGRYPTWSSEQVESKMIKDDNWLGAIGRNMLVDKEIALQNRFIEMETMGFEDLEFAYRQQMLGRNVILTNALDLACLHVFHDAAESKMHDYAKTFAALVAEQRLPLSSQKWFFPN